MKSQHKGKKTKPQDTRFHCIKQSQLCLNPLKLTVDISEIVSFGGQKLP